MWSTSAEFPGTIAGLPSPFNQSFFPESSFQWYIPSQAMERATVIPPPPESLVGPRLSEGDPPLPNAATYRRPLSWSIRL